MLACVSNKLQLLANLPVFHRDFQGENTQTRNSKKLTPPRAAITSASKHRATGKKTKRWGKKCFTVAAADTATDRATGPINATAVQRWKERACV